MGSNGKKTILITGDLHARLADMGKKGDTFSDIIEKALDTIEALQNRAIEEGELNWVGKTVQSDSLWKPLKKLRPIP